MDIRAAAASGAHGLDHRRAVLVPRGGGAHFPRARPSRGLVSAGDQPPIPIRL